MRIQNVIRVLGVSALLSGALYAAPGDGKLATAAMNGDRDRCLQAGMSGYVSKPVQPTHLLATIEHHLTTVVHEPTPPTPTTATRAARRRGKASRPNNRPTPPKRSR